jgi:hypothetical protein
MESTVATADIINPLTCWKCGEDTLAETQHADAAHGVRGEPAALTTRHSVCQKCGSYAVNPEQATHNKNVGRKARKALIREANRSST